MAASNEVANDPVQRWRWLILAADTLMIAALSAAAAVHHPHWRWSLVIWGAAIVLIGLAMTEFTNVVALNKMDVPDSRRELLRHRRPINVANALSIGLALGILSAIAGSAAIDVFGAVLVTISLIVNVTLAVSLVRRRRRSSP